MQKPLLKYVGGKTQILDKLIPEFPTEINNYHEIFVGGGSVLLAVISSKINIEGNMYAYDLNETLINFYLDVQSKPNEFFDEISNLIDSFNNCNDIGCTKEEFYYQIRTQYNKINNCLLRSAMFLFLNKTGFRGLYRVGPNGYNVPYGHYKNPKIIDKEHLLEVSNLIRKVIFRVADFKYSMTNIAKGDFLYLDPPYASNDNKAFVGYNKNGFNEHLSLFKICHELKNKDIRFILSNSDAKLVTDSFIGYDITIVSCKRKINSKNPESKVNEVIIKSF